MKRISKVHKTKEKHWVGNGFYVQPMFNYNKDKNLDPFLLMDYNSPKFFSGRRKNNSQSTLSGVKPHPHRGFETVTIAYQGEISHSDSNGSEGTIGAGDVQWMTAGSGVMHEEKHSEKFTKEGGMFEMVQIWVNLPAKNKMTEPKYQVIRASDIPDVNLPNEAGIVCVIAGNLFDTQGIANTFTPINVWDTQLNSGKSHTFSIPASHNLIILVLDGTILINNTDVICKEELVTFKSGGSDVLVEANKKAKILILTAKPLNEPIVGYGPFVMNTKSEIYQAYYDIHVGKFGRIR
ncbi:pirin family protein [Rodentibacter caecimuris]|uniref:Quercetin 2,3-dioxygenase n=1 Tax=Rodentibacter caecimuris TaxID=1796644 RepID=A0ABX3L0F9_9PAST|nr:quercetin 2,3-dioxygenase [Rodentibacter heylii]